MRIDRNRHPQCIWPFIYTSDTGKNISLEVDQKIHRPITTFPIGGMPKRAFDFILALLLIILALPLFTLLVLFIKLASPGPVIYKHDRVGFGGRVFGCFKFRTMHADAEEALIGLLGTDPGSRAQWERCQKLVDDPRVTPVGRFLRRFGLDELPQLINVIRGEMSLVGPRPITSSELPRYHDKLGFYLSIRPGLTGAWQASGGSDWDYDQRVEVDVNYVSCWRFSTDLLILLRTPGTILIRKGRY